VGRPPVVDVVGMTTDPSLPQQDWAPTPLVALVVMVAVTAIAATAQELHVERQYHYTDNRSGQG
jgi:FlaG/FlaF family flagellin (archaellin)